MSFLRRRVRHRDMLAVLAITLLMWLVVVAAGAAYLRDRYDATLTLHDQAVHLSLPPDMPARAQALTPLSTHLDWSPTVAVPINQTVRVNLPDTLSARAVVNSSTPIDTTVDFAGSIPVTIQLDMLLPVRSWLPRVHVKTPVSLVVPVKLTVPIHAQVPLNLDTLITAQINQPLNVPLRTTFKVRVPIHTDAQALAINETDFTLRSPVEALSVKVQRADLRVPLKAIEWSKRAQP